MSPKLRRLTGQQTVAAFVRCGFVEVSRQGSHAKLRRVDSEGRRQTVTVPVHGYLPVGTLRAIVRQASRYLTEEDIQREFYNL